MRVDRSTRFIVIAVVLLFVLMPLGLYAYRAQSPAVSTIPITAAVQEVQSGRVLDVGVEGNRATLTLTDGAHEQTTLPGPGGDPLQRAVADWNQANPARPITFHAQEPSPLPFIGGALLGLLPPIVLVALIVALAAAFARTSRGDPYERLARAADLRDRGVLTEDEFQREKRRVLGAR